MTFEPPVGLVQIVRVDQWDPVQPAPQPVLAERVPEPVERERAGHRAGRRGDEHQHDVDLPLAGQVTGHGQDDLAGDGRDEVLQGHEQADTDRAQRLDDRGDPPGQPTQLSEVHAGEGTRCSRAEPRRR
jgi:hypothetical protein